METEEKTKYLVGRPTLYDSSILQKVSDYLHSCQDSGDSKNIRVNLPKVEGLAAYLRVNKDTLYEWAKKYQEFSDALKMIKNEQFCRLVDEGLSGRYNATIVKLILGSNHGLNDITKETVGLVKQNEEYQQMANKTLIDFLNKHKQ